MITSSEQVILKSNGIITETKAIIILKSDDFYNKYNIYEQENDIDTNEDFTEFFIDIETAHKMKEITDGVYAILKNKQIEGITYILDY